MSYADNATTAADPDFQNRIRLAVLDKAATVLQSASPTATDANVATKVIRSIGGALVPELSQWAANAGLDAESTDTQIDTKVDLLWDKTLAVRLGVVVE